MSSFKVKLHKEVHYFKVERCDKPSQDLLLHRKASDPIGDGWDIILEGATSIQRFVDWLNKQ